MFDENFDKNNARRVRETHNNKRPAFGARSFTSTWMAFLMMKIKNVSFTLVIMTFKKGRITTGA